MYTNVEKFGVCKIFYLMLIYFNQKYSKTVRLWNIITVTGKTWMNSCDEKLNFQQALLQFSMSHGSSEIFVICDPGPQNQS